MWRRRVAFLILLTVAVAAARSQASEPSPLRPIHLLRHFSGSAGEPLHGFSCSSWQFAVETHNLIDWDTVPLACEGYLGNYMLGHHYRKDSSVVVDAAILHAQSWKLNRDRKDVWVFDVDETALSNLPYYAAHGFGVQPYNSTLFNAWVSRAAAPPLPETLRLYGRLLRLGFKIVFITGRAEDQRSVTTANLVKAGFRSWEKLILKTSEYTGNTAVVYKSSQRKALESSGYRIVGNIGDQWSDLLGTSAGNRTFKLPDPMYYIS